MVLFVVLELVLINILYWLSYLQHVRLGSSQRKGLVGPVRGGERMSLCRVQGAGLRGRHSKYVFATNLACNLAFISSTDLPVHVSEGHEATAQRPSRSRSLRSCIVRIV